MSRQSKILLMPTNFIWKLKYHYHQHALVLLLNIYATLRQIPKRDAASDYLDLKMLAVQAVIHAVNWNTPKKLTYIVYWPFVPPVVGALTHGNNATQIVWKVEEVVDYTPPSHVSDFERFSIRSIDCKPSNTTDLVNGLCPACIEKKRLLLKRFETEIDLREQPINVKTRISLERTHSMKDRRTGIACLA
eukprot:scaffold37101_cov57-Cyclotella_meneghiniana.AAC.1